MADIALLPKRSIRYCHVDWAPGRGRCRNQKKIWHYGSGGQIGHNYSRVRANKNKGDPPKGTVASFSGKSPSASRPVQSNVGREPCRGTGVRVVARGEGCH